MWTYNRTNHLMVDLETLIVLDSMTYITYLCAYELYPGDGNVFNDFLLVNARFVHYACDRD